MSRRSASGPVSEDVNFLRTYKTVALRKLRLVNTARSLEDLRVPPGNRLEALKGKRAGQHSIRINEQWRLSFNWQDGGPSNVGIVDYLD